MAENETAPVAEAEAEEFVYPVTIEDVGPGAKKVSVEIPHDRIQKKLAEQFKELRQQASLPGFRPGHAPQKLIEKRFSHDVKEQVRGALIQESYEQVLEKHALQVIGEPDFQDPEKIKLPDEGPLSYSFQVEVQPEVKLPDFGGLTVKKPTFKITDENVDQAMINLRTQQGTLVPVEDRGVEKGDYLVADVHVKLDGNVVTHQHDAQLVSRAGRIAGIAVEDLDAKLAGQKPGETRTFTVHAPDSHANEAIRDKDVEVEVALKDIKHMELAEVNPSFLSALGFDDEAPLRQALREQMEEKLNGDVETTMREQVNRYLLDNTQVELPAKLSEKQADRVISRRSVDLMMRGLPREQVEANIESLRAGAKDEASRELKLFFILQKLATEQNVEVDENELNGRIAMMAAQSDRRPEKLKQEWSKDGTLQSLYIQMREQKAIDKVLQSVKIEEVDVADEAKK